MKSSEMVCMFGKLFAGNISDDCCTLTEAVQTLAYVGDQNSLSCLPPIIMNTRETVSSQQVWSMCSSPGASFDGYVNDHPLLYLDFVLLGGAILPIGTTSYPVLLFVNHETKQVVACLYDVTLSQLESDLYKSREKPCPIEVKWKGLELASTHVNLMEMLGTYVKSIGISALPEFLLQRCLERKYYFARNGPIPFLHMRTANSDYEFDQIEKLLLSHVKFRSKKTNVSPTWKNWDSFHGICDYEFVTIFSKGTIEEIAESANLSPTPNFDENVCSLNEVHKLAHWPAIAFPIACLVCCNSNVSEIQVDMTSVFEAICKASTATVSQEDTTVGNVNSVTDSKSSCSFHRLMELSSKVFSIQNLCSSGSDGLSQAHQICSCVFESADVGMAVRGLNVASGLKPTQQLRDVVVELAKRVHGSRFVLVMEITSSRTVRSARLLNSELDYKLDMDCTARILDCPWVMPLGIIPTSKEFAKVFTLEANGLSRDMLRVSDSIRTRYSSHSQHQVHPLPLPVDYASIDERLSKFQKLVETVHISIETLASGDVVDSCNSKSKTSSDRTSALKRLKTVADQLTSPSNAK